MELPIQSYVTKYEQDFDTFITTYLFMNPDFDTVDTLERILLDSLLKKMGVKDAELDEYRSIYLKLFYLIRDMTIQYSQYKDKSLQNEITKMFQSKTFDRSLLQSFHSNLYVCTAYMRHIDEEKTTISTRYQQIGFTVVWKTLIILDRIHKKSWNTKVNKITIPNDSQFYMKLLTQNSIGGTSNTVAQKLEREYFNGKVQSPFQYNLYIKALEKQPVNPVMQRKLRNMFIFHLLASIPLPFVLIPFAKETQTRLQTIISSIPIIPSQYDFLTKMYSSVMACELNNILTESCPGIKTADFTRIDEWFSSNEFGSFIHKLYVDKDPMTQYSVLQAKALQQTLVRDVALKADRVETLLNPLGTLLEKQESDGKTTYKKVGIQTIIRGYLEKLYYCESNPDEINNVYELCCKMFAHGFAMSYGYRALYASNSALTVSNKTELLEKGFDTHAIYSELEKPYINALLKEASLREGSEGGSIYQYDTFVFPLNVTLHTREYDVTSKQYTQDVSELYYRPSKPEDRKMASLGRQIKIPEQGALNIPGFDQQNMNDPRIQPLIRYTFEHEGINVTGQFTSADALLHIVEEHGDFEIDKERVTIRDVGFRELEHSGTTPVSLTQPYSTPYGSDIAEVMRPEFFGKNPYYSKYLDGMYHPVMKHITDIGILFQLNKDINDAISTTQKSLSNIDTCSATIDQSGAGRVQLKAEHINILNKSGLVNFIKRYLTAPPDELEPSKKELELQYRNDIEETKHTYEIKTKKGWNTVHILDMMQRNQEYLQDYIISAKHNLRYLDRLWKHSHPTFNNF